MKIVMILGLMLTGCAHSIHNAGILEMQGIPIESGEVVRAEAQQFVIMGFASETQYVNQAYKKLLAECPNKSISAIGHRHSTSLGFFSWTNKLVLQGLCK